MIFDSTTGTTTSFTTTTVTNSAKSYVTDIYRGWTLSIGGSEFEIKSNSDTVITLEEINSLADNDDYTISLLTRSVLAKTDDKLSDTTLFSNSLVNAKIRQSYVDFEQKVFANFKHLLSKFSTGEIPQDYIYNLFRIKQALVYYCLYLLFTDQSIQDEDFFVFKAEQYKSRYKECFKDGISLVTVDLDKNGTYSNGELGSKMSSSMVLGR